MPSFAKDMAIVHRILTCFREVEAEMPLQMAQTFIEVALQPGLTMQLLADRTGLSQSSCSRNVQSLGKWHRVGKPGYDLLEAVDDPVDTRRKIIFLTKRGRDLAGKLVGVVRGERVDFESPTAKDALAPVFKARMARS